jgi:plastocyanin
LISGTISEWARETSWSTTRMSCNLRYSFGIDDASCRRSIQGYRGRMMRRTTMDRTRAMLSFSIAVMQIAVSGVALAATLDVTVNNGKKPVQDAVVFAIPLDGKVAMSPAEPASVDQIDKQYVPHVTPIQVGATVSFPNSDNIRHHVYSFSPTLTFEIPLYQGMPSEPIVFDKPGPVTLGCNIHDWMTGYIFVAESQYFAVTGEDGKATLEGLPPGDYKVAVWHPTIKGDYEATGQEVVVGGPDLSSVAFKIDQKRVWSPRRSPSARREGYR